MKTIILILLIELLISCSKRIMIKDIDSSFGFEPNDTLYFVSNDTLYFNDSIVFFIGRGIMKAEKTFKDSTGEYLIKYEYDEQLSFVPATTNGKPHYHALITVYKLIKIKSGGIPITVTITGYESIGEQIEGIYVVDGCFEDVPEYWVKKAKGK